MYYYVCLCLILCLLYLLLRYKLSYWERRGAPSLPISLISSELKWLIMKQSRFQYFKDIYDQLAPHKYGGYSVMPLKLMVRDPEIIKYVLTKEFENFSSREKLFFTKSDPLTHFIFNLEGKEWKDTRARLTPGFSSSRLKHMFNLISECAGEMDKGLQISEDGQIVNVCKILRKYVLNVIFTCTFGMKVNSMNNGCDIFLKMSDLIRGDSEISKKISNFSFIFPSAVRHYIKSSIYGEHSRNFFRDIILESIKYREENDIKRNDFLQIFISLMKEEGEGRWTLDKALAHGILYIVAGLSNTTNSVSFLLYEMAKHPELQEKLHEEIDTMLEEFNGELNYECVSNTTYLNKVISETMRKYSIVSTFSRRCTNTCALPDGFVIEKGTLVVLSISGLHHDPAFYPDPLKFDPERFNEENKNARHPYCFLPFGAGPRYCIGERFSMLMIKAAVFTILRKFSVSVLPEHEIGFEFLPNKLTTEVQSIKLQLTRRSDSKKMK